MSNYTPCPKCKHGKTVLMSSLGQVTFYPDQEPYKADELLELEIDVDIQSIGINHCENCNHSFGIWIEEE